MRNFAWIKRLAPSRKKKYTYKYAPGTRHRNTVLLPSSRESFSSSRHSYSANVSASRADGIRFTYDKQRPTLPNDDVPLPVVRDQSACRRTRRLTAAQRAGPPGYRVPTAEKPTASGRGTASSDSPDTLSSADIERLF